MKRLFELANEAAAPTRGERSAADYYRDTIGPLFTFMDALRNGGYLRQCNSEWVSPSYSHGSDFRCRCRHHAGHGGRCVCTCRSWINRPKGSS